MILRPELVEKILAGEAGAARILEPGYVGSVRRYHSRWRDENRLAWCGYFSHLAGALRARAEEYDHKVQTLMQTTEERKTA